MNWKKILLFNIFIIILIIIAFETYSYHSYTQKHMEIIVNNAQNTINPKEDIKKNLPRYVFPVEYNFKKHRNKDKIEFKGTSDKRPIIVIGCSYAYGILLPEEKTLAGQLNKVTGRTTYNLGQPATGPQIVYEQLNDPDIKQDVPDAEYIIYVFIQNHIMRQFMNFVLLNGSEISPKYELDKDNNLKKQKMLTPKILYTFFTLRNYLDKKMVIKDRIEFQNGLPLFRKTLEESIKISQKNYPNCKFVLLEFPQGAMCEPTYVEKSQELKDENIKALEDIGVIYINAEQLAGHKFRDVKKYRLADKDHPNDKVWEEIAPALKAKLNL